MSKNKKIFIALILIIAILIFSWYYFDKKKTEKKNEENIARELKNSASYNDIKNEAIRKGVSIDAQLKLIAKRVAKAKEQ